MCHKNKPLGEFSTQSSRCRDCQRIYKADWIAKNPEAQRGYERKRKAKVRAYIHEAKDKPCADCGQRHPYYVMEFDHVRGEKKFNIAPVKGARWMCSFQDLVDEIAKCDVVCANCHRYRHAPVSS